MPVNQNSLKVKTTISINPSGEERLKLKLSGNLLPDTNVDWYYLMFKVSIEDDTRTYGATIFMPTHIQLGVPFQSLIISRATSVNQSFLTTLTTYLTATNKWISSWMQSPIKENHGTKSAATIQAETTLLN